MRRVLLALLAPLLGGCYAEPLVFRGEDVADRDGDFKLIGDLKHDVVTFVSIWKAFELQLPYSEDWIVFDWDGISKTVFFRSTDLHLLGSVTRFGRALTPTDEESELREVALGAFQAVHKEPVEDLVFRKHGPITIMEFKTRDGDPWVHLDAVRRLNVAGKSYFLSVSVKERGEPALSLLLERIRDMFAGFKILPETKP